MIIPKLPPDFKTSDYIKNAKITWTKQTETGDMWPMTWADDGWLYAGAGDNCGTYGKNLEFSPMNLWRANGDPKSPDVELVHHLPVDPAKYCLGENVHKKYGVKPAGLICLDGMLYMAVENINYGDRPEFNRQHNLNGWIITSSDYGKTWDTDATPQDFFTGRVTSCHFIQAGQGNNCVIDGYVWANFPCGLESDDSWWCNGDGMLLGRVKPKDILKRDAWEFFTGEKNNEPQFSKDYLQAVSIFTFMHFTGEDHISYNPYIKRYILSNYAFYDPNTGEARPYHTEPQREYVTQLTLYESKSMRGPWNLFYQDDNWLTGGYQPSFPCNWMNPNGESMTMLGSGNNEYYCFVTQGLEYEIL
jgi:hypothetical protein